MRVKRIVSTIETQSLDRACQFYRDFFELELVMDHGWIRTYASDSMTPAQINFAIHGGSGGEVADLSIEVDDLSAALHKAAQYNLNIEYGPAHEPWGVSRFHIRDPLGRLINILQHELPDRSDTAKCRETVSVLADVQNIYYTTKQIHHCHFNYSAFWLKATENRRVVNAVAYAIDRGDARQRQFQKILSSIGFNIKLKPYIQRADGSTKGDWDIGITLDALDFAKRSDTIVLVSGDGDFDLLVNKIRNDYSARVEVYSVSQLTAASLKNAATEHFAIENELLLRE